MEPSIPVLHIINGEFYSGAERVQDLLALRLPDFGFKVGFVCLKNGIFPQNRIAKDSPLYSFPMRTRVELGIAVKISRIARLNGYRLIHTHTPRAALLGQISSRLTGLPMVHHVHSPTLQDTENGWRNIRNSLMEKVGLIRARKLIPVSKSLEHYLLLRGYKPELIKTVYNGVPVQNKARMPHHQREQLVIGTIALFRPRKGIDILLNAMAILKNTGHAIKLLAVGPFETEQYRATVMKLAEELGLRDNIEWHGFTDDVINELKKMHVFVLPSLYGEGMPMVVLEAMSAGLPVVSTKVEGIPEIIRDGVDGLLLSAGNIEELADALRKLASHELNGDILGDNGWLRQREIFSDHAMARDIASVYREILG